MSLFPCTLYVLLILSYITVTSTQSTGPIYYNVGCGCMVDQYGQPVTPYTGAPVSTVENGGLPAATSTASGSSGGVSGSGGNVNLSSPQQGQFVRITTIPPSLLGSAQSIQISTAMLIITMCAIYFISFLR